MCADLKKEKELLVMDKAFLQREVSALVLKGNEAERRVDGQSDTIRKLEEKVGVVGVGMDEVV